MVALALIGAASIATAREIQHYSEDGWQLTIRHDRFTDAISCDLRARDGRIIYQKHAVGFRFGKRRDTFHAWYRIDSAAALRWQDRYPALIASGAAIDGQGMDNPTGGVVWLPLDEVEHATVVTIRPDGRGQGRPFRMRGFATMLDAARRLGCEAL